MVAEFLCLLWSSLVCSMTFLRYSMADDGEAARRYSVEKEREVEIEREVDKACEVIVSVFSLSALLMKVALGGSAGARLESTVCSAGIHTASPATPQGMCGRRGAS